MDIVGRAKANLPPVPSSVGRRSLASWAGIRVHHTGGTFSSWRAVHDWQTAGRPIAQRLSYIGYSFGIAGGVVTELRGWDRHPAHDHENSRIGVVFGGNYQGKLPPTPDLIAFEEFVREAERRCGKRLPVTTHREAWPAGHQYSTTCPGDKLHAWVKARAARPPQTGEGDDMTKDEVKAAVLAAVREALNERVPYTVGSVRTHATAAGWGELGTRQIVELIWAATRFRGPDPQIAALTAVVEQLATAIGQSGGSVDTTAILAGVDARLAALRASVEADVRDAIGDYAEGGSAAVRADA